MVSEHIEQREGVYYVRGTRISLDSIVYAFREGCSPETIHEDFEWLTLALVYGASVPAAASRFLGDEGSLSGG